MHELEVRGDDAVRELIHADEADESMSGRERFAGFLDDIRSALRGSRELPRREAHAGDACRCEQGLFERACLIQLQLQELLQGPRQLGRLGTVARDYLPARGTLLDESALDEVMNDRDHEERIAVGIVIDEV